VKVCGRPVLEEERVEGVEWLGMTGMVVVVGVVGVVIDIGRVDEDEREGKSVLCDVVCAGVEVVDVELAVVVPFFAANPTRCPS
jgi:hypothetical protein